MKIQRAPSNGLSSNREPYLRSLCRHAHELIIMGYGRLTPSHFAVSDETEITGELVRTMREAMQENDAPEWVDRYALPKDDPPLNVPHRRGPSRPRVDIEFERVKRGPRPTLRFEAKRLGPNHPVSGYLGKDGLGCFLTGKYPSPHHEAGMLGYIQNDDEDAWAKKIASSLDNTPKKYLLSAKGEWRRVQVTVACPHTYQTVHATPKSNGRLTVHHVLLCFC